MPAHSLNLVVGDRAVAPVGTSGFVVGAWGRSSMASHDTDALKQGFFQEVQSISSLEGCEALRVKYLGRKGL